MNFGERKIKAANKVMSYGFLFVWLDFFVGGGFCFLNNRCLKGKKSNINTLILRYF